VLAFQRSWQQTGIIVVVPRWLAKLMQGEIAAPTGAVWEDTAIRLPASLEIASMHELFSARSIGLQTGELRVSELLASFPVAVLVSRPHQR
jgi:(1->4)-alpha-D-glucan 1-alpha-D-glucosylmutase